MRRCARAMRPLHLPVTLLLIGGGAAITARAAQASPAAQASFTEGQALASAKQYGEAAEKFRAAITDDPQYAAAWYGLAASERKAGHCDKAIAAYRKYATLAPTEPEPYYGLGLCLRDTGERAGALASLKRYVSMEKRPESQKWVDHANGVIGDLEEANAGEAQQPEASSPAESPMVVQARKLRDQGRIEEAIAKLRQAVGADPKSMSTRLGLGELLLQVHRDDDAIEVFRATVGRQPTYAPGWYDLAAALRSRGFLAEAVDAYRRCISLNPSDPDPYYGLARALQHLGRSADARNAYETYVRMEKRASEKQWVDAAQAELQALANAR